MIELIDPIDPPRRFMELFAGSASLTYALPLGLLAKTKVTLADNCAAVLAVHRALTEFPAAALQAEIESWTPKASDDPAGYLKRCYLTRREQLNENSLAWAASGECVLTLAAVFIYLNRTCWNALWRTNKKGEFNVPFGDRKFTAPTLREIELARARLLSCEDCETLLGDWKDSLKSFSPRRGDLIYADPPYDETEASYGVRWTDADHDKLARVLRACWEDGATVVVSQPETEKALLRFSWCPSHEVVKRPGGHKVGGVGARRKSGSELLFIARKP